MSQTFGRRSPQYAATWRPEPVAAAAASLDPPAAKGAWKPVPDPEFEAWRDSRATTRWKTWGLAGLIALGGPMSFLMPDGVGQWAGWGLTAVGVVGFVARLRKPAEPAPPQAAAALEAGEPF